MQSLKLQKFDAKSMERRRVHPKQGPPTIVIIGSRGTGKTHLVKELMYNFRKVPAGMMITGSESSAETFSEFFPKSFIYDDVDIERIERVAANQTKLRKKKTDGDYSSLLLFDDCGYDKSIANQKIIRKIFCNGRHLKILLIMTVQYCKDIPPALRSNADYVFIFQENAQENRRKLWKEYASIIPTFAMFNDVMNICTDNRGILVIDNTSISNNIVDNVFWFRCKETLKKFKVGSSSLWKFHDDNYKSEESEEEKYTPPEKKDSIVVKKVRKKKVNKTIKA
jgi:hypothetical protein